MCSGTEIIALEDRRGRLLGAGARTCQMRVLTARAGSQRCQRTKREGSQARRVLGFTQQLSPQIDSSLPTRSKSIVMALGDRLDVRRAQELELCQHRMAHAQFNEACLTVGTGHMPYQHQRRAREIDSAGLGSGRLYSGSQRGRTSCASDRLPPGGICKFDVEEKKRHLEGNALHMRSEVQQTRVQLINERIAGGTLQLGTLDEQLQKAAIDIRQDCADVRRMAEMESSRSLCKGKHSSMTGVLISLCSDGEAPVETLI